MPTREHCPCKIVQKRSSCGLRRLVEDFYLLLLLLNVIRETFVLAATGSCQISSRWCAGKRQWRGAASPVAWCPSTLLSWYLCHRPSLIGPSKEASLEEQQAYKCLRKFRFESSSAANDARGAETPASLDQKLRPSCLLLPVLGVGRPVLKASENLQPMLSQPPPPPPPPTQ